MRIEEDIDLICRQPNGLDRAVELPTNVLVSITLVVSCRDDFTPVSQTQLFRSLFFETNETMNYIVISKHISKPTYESRETGDICNPVNTLYSRIIYNYAQFNKMRIFP